MANNSLTFQQNRRKNIAAFLNFLTLKQGTFFFRARGSIRGFGNNPTAGLFHRSRVTGHESQVTGHRSRVTFRGSQIYEYVNTRYVEFIVTTGYI
jgi:hypothetical protein